MESYKKMVRDAAARRDGQPIYNSSVEHAGILSSALLQHAKNDVCILAGDLDASIYGTDKIVEKARIFLSIAGRKIHILLSDIDQIDVDDHPFFTEFLGKGDVKFRVLPDGLKDIEFRFVVMDGDSYRFQSDKNQYSAVAAFGDQKGGKNLSNVFDQLWKQSIEFPN